MKTTKKTSNWVNKKTLVLFSVLTLLLLTVSFSPLYARTVKILKDVSTDALNVVGNLVVEKDIIIKGNVGIGQTSPGAKLTVNNTTAGGEVGSAGDGIYSYASSINSAIVAKQGNSSGYGIYSMADQNYFSGKLKVAGKVWGKNQRHLTGCWHVSANYLSNADCGDDGVLMAMACDTFQDWDGQWKSCGLPKPRDFVNAVAGGRTMYQGAGFCCAP